MRCPQCDYMMGSFDAECPRCHGRGLTVPLPATSQSVAPPMQNAVASSAPLGQVFCNHCGAPNASNVAFCSSCGQHLAAVQRPGAAPTAALAPAMPIQDGWVTPPHPQYPPAQPMPQQYPPYAAPAYPPQQYPPQYAQQYPPQYAPPIQNNVNVVVTQQNTNRNSGGGSGWLAALLVLMFGTPLGCIAIPAAIVLLAVAFQFAPIIISVIAALAIGKSTMPSDKKAMFVGGTLLGGFIINGLLLMSMYAQHAPVR